MTLQGSADDDNVVYCNEDNENDAELEDEPFFQHDRLKLASS
jgi:hypothetical protein